MSVPALAENHSVLPVERIQDTLVVTPAGDLLGFSRDEFRRELAIVEKLLADKSVHHLIINLSQADYFGAEMMSALRPLGDRLRGRGAMIFSEASPAMRETLNRLGLNVGTAMFRSSASALSDVTESQMSGTFYATRVTYRRYNRAVYAVAAVLLCAAAAWGLTAAFQASQPRRDFDQLVAVWSAIRDARAAGPQRFEQRVNKWHQQLGVVQDRYRSRPALSEPEQAVLELARAVQRDLLLKTGTPETAAAVEQGIQHCTSLFEGHD